MMGGGANQTLIGDAIINEQGGRGIIHVTWLRGLVVYMTHGEPMQPANMVLEGFVLMSSGLMLDVTGGLLFHRLTAPNGPVDPGIITIALPVANDAAAVAYFTTYIAVPGQAFNDADLSDSEKIVHLVGPCSPAAVFSMARHAIESNNNLDNQNVLCRSIMWVKAFSNTTAPAQANEEAGGFDLLGHQLNENAVEPVIQPEIEAGEAGGAAQAQDGNPLSNPGALPDTLDDDVPRTEANVLRAWAMYVRDTTTLGAYAADPGFPGTRLHLRTAVFATVLAYGISRGAAPEGQGVADAVQAQAASASGIFSILNTGPLRTRVAHCVNAIRSNRLGWDAVMIVFAERVVQDGHLDRPLTSWLRTRLLNCHQRFDDMKSFTSIPRDNRSAGFCCDGMWFHFALGIDP